MKTREIFRFVFSMALPLMAGAIGSIFTVSSVSSWYKTLVQPEFAPPSWLFGPVWTLLYVLMGIALYLVWRKGTNTPGVKTAVSVFLIQLVLNALWSFLFFGSTSLTINGLSNIGIAFFEIVLLWLSIAVTMFFFSKISRTATWLLVPYILWVSFAGYLNYSIWMLN